MILASSNLCNMTFYVENYSNRPGTVDIDYKPINPSIRRKCTPLVRNRDIRRKFFSNQETI
jgi:hypothetical protein